MSEDGPWVRVRLGAPAPSVAALEALLTTLGAVAVTLEDARDTPLLEPAPGELPLWADVVVSGLFPASPDPRALLEAAAGPWRAGSGAALPEATFEAVGDDDWISAWRQHAVALSWPGRLHLVADDADAAPDDGGVVLRLAPGLAFGTGGHATTRGCLAQLAAWAPLSGSVLDFGCGSGVLAIAALQLGATSAVGIDHDPQALVASRHNAEVNGVSDRIVLGEALADDDEAGGVDLLLANVLAGPLVAFAPRLMRCVAPGGRVVLSGILPEQASSVRDAWSDFALDVHEDDGWIVLSGGRRAS